MVDSMKHSWLWHVFTPKKKKVAEFLRLHEPQADSIFVAECGYESDIEASKIALGVRRCIAEMGGIPPEYIRHDHRFPDDIGNLDFWDSIDEIGFLVELEANFNRRLPDEPLIGQGFVVKDLVRRIVAVIPKGPYVMPVVG